MGTSYTKDYAIFTVMGKMYTMRSVVFSKGEYFLYSALRSIFGGGYYSYYALRSIFGGGYYIYYALRSIFGGWILYLLCTT